MVENRIGARYATSILGLAKEKGKLERVHEDFVQFQRIYQESPEFRQMLASPLIQPAKKQAILQKLFKDRFHEITYGMLSIVSSKHREPLLGIIAQEFLHLYDKQKGIIRAELTTAFKLDESEKREILRKFEQEKGAKIEVIEKVDPSLIGGFVLKIGDIRYDGSISNALNKLKQEFKSNPYIQN